jgi:hypothetical protein
MKKMQSSKGISARTLRLHRETVKQLSELDGNQLRQAAGGTGIHSLDDFCYEASVYCPA